MKQETKELIDWMKKQFSIAGTVVTDISQPNWQKDQQKAIEFLDSLPKIEARLCFGGYIQDRNGTPCCHGDKVKFKFVEKWYEEHFKDKYTLVMDGLLQYSKETKSFYIQFGPYTEGWDWFDWTVSDTGCEWFEKIEG